MMRSRIPFLRMTFLLIRACSSSFPAPPGGGGPRAILPVPPYVRQSVLPSVTLLVSNSQSMGKFAYPDPDPSRTCATTATACGGFDPSKRYYGIFLDNAYYTNAGSNAAGGSRFSFAGYKGSYTKGTNDWDGNFLNWLTMRRIDVMKKVLTGGNGTGSQACGSVTEQYKEFTDNGRTYSIYNSGLQTAQFPIATTGRIPAAGPPRPSFRSAQEFPGGDSESGFAFRDHPGRDAEGVAGARVL